MESEVDLSPPAIATSSSSDVLPLDGIHPRLFDGALNGYLLAVVLFHQHRDLRVLQVGRPKLRREVSLELLRGLSCGLTSPTRGRLMVPVSETCTVFDSSGTLNTVMSSMSAAPIR